MGFKFSLSAFLGVFFFIALLLGFIPTEICCVSYGYGLPFAHIICGDCGTTLDFKAALLNVGVYALGSLLIVGAFYLLRWLLLAYTEATSTGGATRPTIETEASAKP